MEVDVNLSASLRTLATPPKVGRTRVADEQHPMAFRCAWCGTPREANAVPDRQAPLPADSLDVVSHGICPACRERFERTELGDVPGHSDTAVPWDRRGWSASRALPHDG